jgi:hypothetical protein
VARGGAGRGSSQVHIIDREAAPVEGTLFLDLCTRLSPLLANSHNARLQNICCYHDGAMVGREEVMTNRGGHDSQPLAQGWRTPTL